MSDIAHITVLRDEVAELLVTGEIKVIVDATLGFGGHTEAISERVPTATIIGIDQDPVALEAAKKRLEVKGILIIARQGNFSDIARMVNEVGFNNVDGIVADLGVSSMQIDSTERGFSFRFDSPLDMRMDPGSSRPTAAELLAELNADEIADILYQFGEERASRKIARRIVAEREAGRPIKTTFELKRIVESCVRVGRKDAIHPATRTFQALRIAVNDELGALSEFIESSVELLNRGGRLVIISFHSLEDRIVKRAFQKLSGKCLCPPKMPKCLCGAVTKVRVITKKPIVPGEGELNKNPRARSAKLRAIEKI
ncbi:16S rRNA (cytosine(1402)-N(4))-methyltransferase RsmH [Leptolyngbya sp. 7M]|uniref:16S rRNA (cytosine(1402)-N(4))-methyltransferase RsmH n=1 Tax=Leptolyngbya sp. 7M TaxID=2812896 RepID=UPI001B8C7985|nr:16S rRNA (cytosine(1402)-N(4))-methyltransferase RsmH [Leptolyngbya sp. 7M]QYO65920.1 16S rRNA (cytosine(1402)-N(4))-methyltransferase RsmH [Leptolyngbya sp. 7M]